MSIPADIATLMKVYKPTVNKFKPGDMVTERAATIKTTMVITQLFYIGTHGAKDADYGTVFFSTQGKPVFKDFKQHELEMIS